MHLNLFTQCSPSPQFKGFWRHPADRSATGYRDLGYWVELGRKLEAACLDALFFADVHGTYDVYEGSWRAAVRHAVQIPSIDPLLVLPAIAATTSRLGLAVTYSTTYHAPYECARVFSSAGPPDRRPGRLEHRHLVSALGVGERARARTWTTTTATTGPTSTSRWPAGCGRRAGTTTRCAATSTANVFTDPDRVREIGHEGRWFSVRGPHQCEPSPQRTPVLYQAGASGAGDDVRGPARRGGLPDHGRPGQRRVPGGPAARRRSPRTGATRVR